MRDIRVQGSGSVQAWRAQMPDPMPPTGPPIVPPDPDLPVPVEEPPEGVPIPGELPPEPMMAR